MPTTAGLDQAKAQHPCGWQGPKHLGCHLLQQEVRPGLAPGLQVGCRCQSSAFLLFQCLSDFLLLEKLHQLFWHATPSPLWLLLQALGCPVCVSHGSPGLCPPACQCCGSVLTTPPTVSEGCGHRGLSWRQAVRSRLGLEAGTPMGELCPLLQTPRFLWPGKLASVVSLCHKQGRLSGQ